MPTHFHNDVATFYQVQEVCVCTSTLPYVFMAQCLIIQEQGQFYLSHSQIILKPHSYTPVFFICFMCSPPPPLLMSYFE
jgi:hypothetical protein